MSRHLGLLLYIGIGCFAGQVFASVKEDVARADLDVPSQSLQDIPAGTMLDCLNAVSRQFDVRVVYTGDLSRIRCRGLKAPQSLLQTMNALLAHSKLTWLRNSRGDVVVRRNDESQNEIILQPLQVEDTAELSSPVDASGLQLVSPSQTPGFVALRALASQTRIDAPELMLSPITEFDQLMRYAPNVYGGGNSFSIRGVGRDSAKRQTAAVILDGLPVPIDMLESSLIGALGLSEIAFNRGPQATHSLSATMAGSVALSSTDPSIEPQAQLTMGFDDLGGARLQASAESGFGGGDLALRVNASQLSDDGSICNQVVARCGVDARDTQSISAKAIYQPERWSPLSIRLHAFANRNEVGDELVTIDPFLTADDAAALSRTSFSNQLNRYNAKTKGYSIDAGWAFDLGQLHLRAYQSNSNSVRRLVNDLTIAAVADDVVGETREQQSRAELSFDGSHHATRFTTGLALEQRQLPQTRFVHIPVDYFSDLAVRIVPATSQVETFRSEFEVETLSFVANLEHDWGEHWRASLGARWLDEQTFEAQDYQRVLSNPDCQIIIGDPETNRIPCALQYPDLALRSEATVKGRIALPALAVAYRLGPKHETGISVKRGYVSGGANPVSLQGETSRYAPEISDSIEWSWNSQWGAHTHFKAALFYTNWRDRQVSQFDPNLQQIFISNAGRSHAQGAELEMRSKFFDSLSVRAGVGVLKTRYDDYRISNAGGEVDFTGNEFQSAPHLTATFGAVWQRGAWFASANAYYAAMAQGNAANTPAARLPDFVMLDARFGYQTEDWTGSIEISNALDELVLKTVSVNNSHNVLNSFVPGPPRRLGVRFEYRF